jgi:hypothetical protein
MSTPKATSGLARDIAGDYFADNFIASGCAQRADRDELYVSD